MTFSLCLFLSFEPFSKNCLSTIVTEFISSKHLESFLISPDLEVYRKYFFWRGYLFMYSIVVGRTARTGHHSPEGWYFTRRVDQSDRIIGSIKDDSSSYGILITGVTLCKKVDKPNMNMPTLESLTHFLHSLSNNGVWKVAAGADCLGKLKISARDRLVARSGSSFTWLPSPWVLMEILLIHNLIWWYLRPFFGNIDCNFFSGIHHQNFGLTSTKYAIILFRSETTPRFRHDSEMSLAITQPWYPHSSRMILLFAPLKDCSYIVCFVVGTWY